MKFKISETIKAQRHMRFKQTYQFNVLDNDEAGNVFSDNDTASANREARTKKAKYRVKVTPKG